MIVGQFEYIDNIQPRYRSTLPSNIQVGSITTEELILTRLLLGTLSVKRLSDGKILTIKTNFSKIDFEVNRIPSKKTITDALEDDNDIDALSRYVTNSIHYGNRKLFKNLLLEVTQFFFKKSSNENLNAFLHIYRTLEFISYCFPLYYASKSTDYHGTFNSLKDFFKGSDNERNFLKNFVNRTLFRGEAILDYRLPIAIVGSNPDIQEQYFNAFFKIKRQDNNNIEVLDNTEFSEIITKRKSLISLIINLRNRTFHLQEGDFNDNLRLDEVYDFDEFFGLFNDIFLNWISLIYFRILNKNIERS